MPSIYQLKPAFQRLLRPIVAALARRGITPNQVTIAAVVLACAVGVALAFCEDRRALLLLPLTLLLRMALNAVDGMLAREHDRMTRSGAVLNELGDVVADAAMYLPLALRAEFPAAAVVVFVLVGIVVEMSGVVAVQIGASRRYDGFGKSDRAAVIGTIGLWLGLGGRGEVWIDAVLWACSALGALAVFTRARRALAEGAR